MKALVIGYGSIGKRHASILNRLGLEVEAVSTQNIFAFKTFKYLSDIDLEEYDYFVIANETIKHHETLIYLENSVKKKQILVEKPLFESKKHLEIINNRVYVAYNLRFHPALQKLRKLVGLEKILFIQARVGQYLPDWRPDRDYRDTYSACKEKGGGVLLDLSHEIDYLQWISGAFQEIAAFQDKLTDLEINSDDFVSGIAKTSKGAIVNFSMDYCSKMPIRDILLHTNHQTLHLNLISGELYQTKKRVQPVLHKFTVDRDETYSEMHKSILNRNESLACSYDEGLRTMTVLDKIKNG